MGVGQMSEGETEKCEAFEKQLESLVKEDDNQTVLESDQMT